ncbi:hypothetical protein ABZ726_23510 [Streptomyces hundungensis]|uniref:hypothetical protein n=1 Tax=Streptomyces hundungensis TaxID=1077946 RepID=UPI0034030B98
MAFGLAKMIDILGAMEEELLRSGEVRTAGQTWTFLVSFNAAATRVLARAGIARTHG